MIGRKVVEAVDDGDESEELFEEDDTIFGIDVQQALTSRSSVTRSTNGSIHPF